MDAPEYIRDLSKQLTDLMSDYVGRDGTGRHDAKYVPLSVLKDYWNRSQVVSAINQYPNLVASPETIIEHFLRVFSLLVYIGRLNFLNDFTKDNLADIRFPLDEYPRTWGDASWFRKLYAEIRESQWMFFPLDFKPNQLYGQSLNSRHILPIYNEEIIREGGSATVTKINTNKNCTAFDQTTFVRKTYSHRYRKHYEREKAALSSLDRFTSPYIVKFYGSFIQQHDRLQPNPTYNLILEYVDGGNLEDFLAHTQPPQTLNETIKFWGAFVGLFEALDLLHISKNDPNNHIQGIHQDIKPENILVAIQAPGGPYDFILKLTDFGLSHTKMIERNGEDSSGVDSHGGVTYGAPECSHHAEYSTSGKHSITTKADIFSIGCVISDTAAWVFKGEEGRKQYREARVSETATLDTFNGSGHDGCFHNGITALETVKVTHAIIGSSTEGIDLITPQILKVVQDRMLVRKDQRWAAKELRECLSKIIQDAGDKMEPLPIEPGDICSSQEAITALSLETTMSGSPENGSFPPRPVSMPPPDLRREITRRPVSRANRHPSFRNTIASSSSLLDPSQTGKILMFPYDEAKSYRQAKKNGWPISENASRVMSKLKNNLKDRDHIFYIDTSETMHARYGEVCEAFELFAYIAKQIDTDGVELFFSSDPSKRHTGTTTNLLRKFREQSWDQMIFEDKFGKFIDKKIIPRLHSPLANIISRFARKSLNIFIFTDGMWGIGKEKAAGVENPIQRIIDEIKNRKLNRTQVAIQFIRFGDDEDGQRYLSYLDEMGIECRCDFVDTKSVNGNLFEMFFGALDPDIDRRP